ncbi:MAG: LPS export ABC transporter ATP-binding protein [Myxococcota bacterium]|nr:LPS export ABC transporter ATP-binding protein [Myxococcota bacterium]
MKSLEAIGLTKAFRGRTVVSDVHLSIAPGEVVGLLGPNGAGKTTTFQMLLGLTRQDRGRVCFGDPIDHLPLHQRARLGIGYLPQGPSVLRGLSVRNNLLALLEAQHKQDPEARADALLTRLGLLRLSSNKARTLSGGERRRLEFCRALCSDPSIILCDEPFAGIDPLASQEISNIILDLKQEDVGVLLTDHNAHAAFSVCDRVYLIVEGSILASGTPEEISASDSARRLYLGDGFMVTEHSAP